ncbi:MAG TPA: cation diffusion facilitator family transporter [Gaiellaceae bacterium]|jgi:cation diffusion facilitator family transporter|nr:cation diffusion facilitator family transporter [Gaiellaceae bacterium]
MTPQRRTALVSVAAAAALLGLKLGVGLVTHSLGLLSEALHSGTDLVAALLTFFAVGYSIRPADRGHHYGHGKAEHLSALAEATILVAATGAIVWNAVARLTGSSGSQVDPAWYAFAVVGVVIAIDVTRSIVSWRAAERFSSAALQSNAIHFGSDLVGSVAVLIGLAFARAGHPDADPIAALVVAVIVLTAAARLIRRNIDVLMDRAPAEATAAARQAIERNVPGISLRRLRLRQAAGRHFVDVVIGVPPGAAVAQGHAAADDVEDAVRRALPESDVVVHVEPQSGSESALRERIQAAALQVRDVREIHNVNVIDVGGRTEISLHLKLPGELSLDEAHEAAEQVEAAILTAVPEVAVVRTHLEPLADVAEGHRPPAAAIESEEASVLRIVRDETGGAPRELRFLETDGGLVAFLTLALDPHTELQAAHATASAIEERIRQERPEISEVHVHTEP